MKTRLQTMVALLLYATLFSSTSWAQTNRLYLIGTATSAGWSLDAAPEMQSQGNGIYTWEGNLNEGELKFLEKQEWLPSLGASANVTSGTQNITMTKRNDYSEADLKFNVTTSGPYRIQIDTNTSALTITSYPAAIFAAGDATTAGWDANNSIVLNETAFGSGRYAARTQLKQGSLTLLKQRGNGDGYGPDNNGATIGQPGSYAFTANATVPVTPPAEEQKPTEEQKPQAAQSLASTMNLYLTTDKACYNPGATVHFNANGNIPSGARVRYRHLGTVVADEALTSNNWSWTPASTDFQGYMAEVYTIEGQTDVIHGTIAVDVSSDWTMFPRYGFIASFFPATEAFGDAAKTDDRINSEMSWLNRCHINGVQFQDWHYKHHWPCPPRNPDGSIYDGFQELANRWNSTNVIKKYIDVQHGYGMKSIFYNLCFGVLDKIVTDEERQTEHWDDTWYLYKDAHHGERDMHPLPSDWKSDIYLTNPANPNWLAWMKDRNAEVYAEFDFDGYQIDQLGGRGDTYDYNGNKIDLWQQYPTFINEMKKANPDKRLIMNAVSEYGTWGIASTNKVDFLYNEVWQWGPGEDQFDHLFFILKDNEKMNPKLKTCFAAYMDYEQDNCEFNTPGILRTDAVMFALGGSHLELGDHMLCREYFPYNGVRMSADLKTQMERYYDFMTAYENILRGGGTELSAAPWCGNSSAGALDTKAWYSTISKDDAVSVTSAERGKVMTYSKKVDSKTVVNLINFRDANSLSWRDARGDMSAAQEVRDITMSMEIDSASTISNVWVASPDYHGGAVQTVPFTRNGNTITITVPAMKYWTMVVYE